MQSMNDMLIKASETIIIFIRVFCSGMMLNILRMIHKQIMRMKYGGTHVSLFVINCHPYMSLFLLPLIVLPNFWKVQCQKTSSCVRDSPMKV